MATKRTPSIALVALVTVVFTSAQAQRQAVDDTPSTRLSLHLDRKDTMDFIRINPGRFRMGGPRTGGIGERKPSEEITIDKPFFLGRTPVTLGQFRAFVRETGYKTDAEASGEGGHGFDPATHRFAGWKPEYTWRHTGWEQSEAHPVVNVSWNDAVRFCQWLSTKSGRTVRLPTEAEWEFAERAGTTTTFFTGDAAANLKGYANVADQTLIRLLKMPDYDEGGFSFEDGYPFTSPVGKFKPNPWGLYDMIGNVWQWCDELHSGPDVPASPQSPRMICGCSYNEGPSLCAEMRGHSTAIKRYSYIGFRVLVEQQ